MRLVNLLIFRLNLLLESGPCDGGRDLTLRVLPDCLDSRRDGMPRKLDRSSDGVPAPDVPPGNDFGSKSPSSIERLFRVALDVLNRRPRRSEGWLTSMLVREDSGTEAAQSVASVRVVRLGSADVFVSVRAISVLLYSGSIIFSGKISI